MRPVRMLFWCLPLVWCAGCDLLNQTTVVGPGPTAEGIRAPLNLSRPDSVLKMLTHLFDRHTPQAAEGYGDLLYEGYVYRTNSTTDEPDYELDRAQEILVYRNIFANFEDISATFTEEDRWTEYGANRSPPPDVPAYQISAAHPDENWTVLRVLGDMSFTNTNDYGAQIGYEVLQRFHIAFRLDQLKRDSTWQMASWTDFESLLSTRPAASGGRGKIAGVGYSWPGDAPPATLRWAEVHSIIRGRFVGSPPRSDGA